MKNHKYFVSWQEYSVNTIKFKTMALLKVIEVLASSPISWEEATKAAVMIASKTVKEIRSVYIQDMSVVVKNNEITEYRVNAKISFEVVGL